MSKQNMSEWIRLNSIRVPLDILLTDGQRLKGAMLVSRDRSLRDALNGSELFIEFECLEVGSMMIAKSSIRSLRQFALPVANQLAEHMKFAASIGALHALGLAPDPNAEQVEAAYTRLSAKYQPSDYAGDNVPTEIVAFVASTAERLRAAYQEVKTAVGGAKVAVAAV